MQEFPWFHVIHAYANSDAHESESVALVFRVSAAKMSVAGT